MTRDTTPGLSRRAANEYGSDGEDAEDQSKSTLGYHSRMKALWLKRGLDVGTALMMAKGALAPTIAIAIYQANGSHAVFGTEGFLVAVAAVLASPIAPRAKFVQTIILTTFILCLGAALNLLGIWSAVQARKHTTAPGAPITEYNSAASVVCAVWLFFEVYAIHYTISARPQVRSAGVIVSIFTVISMINAPNFPDMDAGIAFAVQTLRTMLTGLAISTGVSLFFAPLTCRQVTFKQMAKYMHGMRKVISAQADYMQSLETQNMFRTRDETIHESSRHGQGSRGKQSPAAKASYLRKTISELRVFHGQLRADMPFAKREIAFGKLSAKDIGKTIHLLRLVFLPLVGMSCLIRIFELVAQSHGIIESSQFEDKQKLAQDENIEEKMVAEWQAIFRRLNKPFEKIRRAMDDAILHILLVLDLEKPETYTIDASREDSPGSLGFARSFEARITEFGQSRKDILYEWREGEAELQSPEYKHCPLGEGHDEDSARHQRQLLIILYIEYLVLSGSRALLDFVRFADHHVAKGTMRRRRLIFPGYKRLKKIFRNLMKPVDSAGDGHNSMADVPGTEDVYFGVAFSTRKDPEHLAPRTAIQRIGNRLRTIPRALRSPYSVYGFRVATAMISIGIPAFLRQTHEFFTANRIYWALIIAGMSMSRTAGQAIFIYTLRICATVIGMISCYVIYYVVDGHTAGVIVMFFLVVFALFYIVVRYPQYLLLGQVAVITMILAIGYELQVAKIGRAEAVLNGQNYYPLYTLAPIRLAATAGGIFVAFLFTIFPYPISETSLVRSDLGKALYLAANHYAVVDETVKARYSGKISNSLAKNSPLYRLDKARERIFGKLMLLTGRVKAEFGFTRWQIPIGGEFPHDTYLEIVRSLENIVDYTALLGHASTALSVEENENESRWRADLRQLFASVETTSDEIISVLCLFSSSLLNSQPLPPHVRIPEAYGLLRTLRNLDREILKYDHISDPCYAAFAVIQIACRSIVADVQVLKDRVEDLVGEFDFSVHSCSVEFQDGQV